MDFPLDPHPPSLAPAPLPNRRRQPGGDQVGYAEFSDKMNASKAKNLYHGWTGWGGRGLAIELTDFAMSQLAAMPGQKRMREGEGACQRVAGWLGGGQQKAWRTGLWLGLGERQC